MSGYLTRKMLGPASRRNVVNGDANLFRRWMISAMRQWQRRRMIKALEAMDDRLLRDIGIDRSDIDRVVGEFDDRELGMIPLAPAAVAHDTDQEAYQKAA